MRRCRRPGSSAHQKAAASCGAQRPNWREWSTSDYRRRIVTSLCVCVHDEVSCCVDGCSDFTEQPSRTGGGSTFKLILNSSDDNFFFL